MDLNILESNSHQLWNALEQHQKQDHKGKGFITDAREAWFCINTLNETTTHIYSYHQVTLHKLSDINLFDKNPDDATIGVVFNKLISVLQE